MFSIDMNTNQCETTYQLDTVSKHLINIEFFRLAQFPKQLRKVLTNATSFSSKTSVGPIYITHIKFCVTHLQSYPMVRIKNEVHNITENTCVLI